MDFRSTFTTDTKQGSRRARNPPCIIVFAEVIRKAEPRSFIHLYTVHYATTHSLAGDPDGLCLEMRSGGHQTPHRCLDRFWRTGGRPIRQPFPASFAFKILSKTSSKAQTGYLPPSLPLCSCPPSLAVQLSVCSILRYD